MAENVKRVEPHALCLAAARVESVIKKSVSRPEYDIPRWYAEDVGAALVLMNDVVAAQASGIDGRLKNAVDRMRLALESPPPPEPRKLTEAEEKALRERRVREGLAETLATVPADRLADVQRELTAAAVKPAEKREPTVAGKK